MKTNQQSGFTLVELVMVIVLIGILAAIAVPRFVSLSVDARSATVDGFAGGVKAAAAVSQAGWMARGANVSTVATVDGQTVAVSSTTGLPTGTSAGIGVAMRCSDTTCDAFTADYTTSTAVTFQLTGSTTPATCAVTYNATTGAVTAAKGGC